MYRALISATRSVDKSGAAGPRGRFLSNRHGGEGDGVLRSTICGEDSAGLRSRDGNTCVDGSMTPSAVPPSHNAKCAAVSQQFAVAVHHAVDGQTVAIDGGGLGLPQRDDGLTAPGAGADDTARGLYCGRHGRLTAAVMFDFASTRRVGASPRHGRRAAYWETSTAGRLYRLPFRADCGRLATLRCMRNDDSQNDQIKLNI
jgi:hypothetical protein